MTVEFRRTSAEGPASVYQTCPLTSNRGVGGFVRSYRKLTAVNFSKGAVSEAGPLP